MHLFFIILLILFGWQIHRNTAYISDSLSDYGIKFFFGLVASIIPTGFLLSEFNLINQALAWGVGVNILASLFNIFFRQITDNQYFNLILSVKKLPNRFRIFWQSQALVGKVSFGILFAGFVITTIINLIILFVTVPNEWDSMTGHLVKCAYYLQNGNMNRLGGTTWTIDFYPNSLPTLQIFGYHVFGEKGFKIIHYLSYWIFAISSYGITKKTAPHPDPSDRPMGEFSTPAFIVFSISLLLPTALVQATTTETDIVLTAYLGCLVYFMFSFKNNPNKLIISLIALMSGIWIGHKITFLLIAPAALVVALHTFLLKKEFYSNIKLFIVTFLIAVGIYALPTGYIGNVREVGKFSLGSLSAPPMVMQWHGVEHYSGKDKLRNFALNIGRYSSEFLNFDGIRSTPTGQKLNESFRYLPNKLLQKLPLEGERFTVVSYFSFEHPIRFYLERPYWGIIGFGLVLPIMIFLLVKLFLNFKQTTSTEKSLMVLGLAAILHFLSLCYSAPYDPIKARYFLNMAVWCLPMLSIINGQLSIINYSGINKAMNGFDSFKSRIVAICFLIITITISLSGVCVVLFTRIHPVFSEKNIFNMSRMEQLTVARPDIYEAYKKFDALVPPNAVVALGTQQEHEDFEYPLWGKDFTRKLIPIHPFRSAVKPIPAEAQYLFYSKGVIPFQAGDILLNSADSQGDTPVEESQFFLRPLTPKGELKPNDR